MEILLYIYIYSTIIMEILLYINYYNIILTLKIYSVYPS